MQRYLHDEPVEACPPSTSYRLRKFARRNKGALAAAPRWPCLLLLTVVSLAVSNAWIRREQAHPAREGPRREGQKLAEGRAEEIRRGWRLKSANRSARPRPLVCQRPWDDAHAAFTKAIKLRPDHASVWMERGDLYARLDLGPGRRRLCTGDEISPTGHTVSLVAALALAACRR